MEKLHRPVRQLSVDVARKIAAGEVIDRPCAIVRELMDNAVDSGADKITVEISGGGIDKIRVSDNGSGMTKEDLKACARPHCTSKISDAEDLLNLTTLGFRGEALSSIAAVSRLTISSGNYQMKASITEDHVIEPIPPVQDGQGTIVVSEELFENFPARRVFLKRPASETMLCSQTFIEKSLPRTDISFRLVVDGSIRHDLPSGVTLAERFTRALELKESSKLFSELKASGKEADGKSQWSFSLVIGEPSVYRNDRKNIFIFVNGRRVSEYSLLQAIEYGCQGFFPNGTHPVAALYLQVDPKMVDFNIHPAKKEVRFKDISSVHHGVSSTVRAWLRSYGIKTSRTFYDDNFETDYEQVRTGFSSSKNPKISASLQTAGKPSLRETERRSNLSDGAGNSLAELAFSGGDFEKFNRSDEWKEGNEKSWNSKNDSGWKRDFSNKDDNSVGSDYARPALKIAENGFRESRFSDKFTHRNLEDQFAALNFSLPENENAVENSGNRNQQLYNTTHLGMSNINLKVAEPEIKSVQKTSDFAYLGTIFGTFLVAMYKNTLYLIDQHAAHERINFNKIMAAGSEKQKLLVPYEIHTESKADDDYLSSIKNVLETSGFETENKGCGTWEISTVPVRFNLSEKDLEDALLKYRKSPDELIYHIAATTACRMSVKDGTILGPKEAANLAWEALQLPDPHCPHGRPVWTTLTKEELFARVRRTR